MAFILKFWFGNLNAEIHMHNRNVCSQRQNIALELLIGVYSFSENVLYVCSAHGASWWTYYALRTDAFALAVCCEVGFSGFDFVHFEVGEKFLRFDGVSFVFLHCQGDFV